MSFSQSIVAQISSQLSASLSLHPSSQWLQTFLTTQKPTTPLSSLLATARIRLLNSDLTSSTELSKTSILPGDVHNPELKERRLPGPIALQVLAVEDLTRSRWEQIEAIEATERGEGTKGREIVRVVADDENGPEGSGANGRPTERGAPSSVSSSGYCKVLLQDAKGVKAWGIELKKLTGIGIGMSIGTKMIISNVLVARGVLLLEPSSSKLIGGKIEALHKVWAENRKTELKAAIEADEAAGG
ncbi:MAG: Superkiller protein 3 [Chaenotheca gracillima]|nr:MAG: Superkiller protein 3 [Chaenotheca gracillima]